MVIVSNTSPISNLAKVSQLGLMQQVYGRILIPRAVHEELLDPGAGATVIAAVQSADWLEVLSVKNQELVSELRTRVNIGEAEAIALAVEVQAPRLIIDERLGRQAASNLGIKVIGALGILLLAKRRKLIIDVRPIMDNLINQANFRISQQLYADVLDAANE
ncbi:DUF3368 domain-containing protein [Leptolyngbya sp. CCNP1308]|uniref:DUF3368 domain-containing protein n=1 Tax=Leptolyngbya sp. CCNP1308 TaxID=3110255 RepID=UPI002B217EB7|nr:DUF3368 domain-containing protein [Leptolyngbya sp. CCNP1308]MEA5448297.1 DUF3368 domain-containing protein [Leptolyngbya sp. CCNP1308]